MKFEKFTNFGDFLEAGKKLGNSQPNKVLCNNKTTILRCRFVVVFCQFQCEKSKKPFWTMHLQHSSLLLFSFFYSAIMLYIVVANILYKSCSCLFFCAFLFCKNAVFSQKIIFATRKPFNGIAFIRIVPYYCTIKESILQ